MAGHVGRVGGLQTARLVLLDRAAHRAPHADDHADPRRLQCLKGVGAAMAGQDDLHALLRQESGRLNARALGQGLAGVVNGHVAEIIGLDDHEAGAPAKTRIDLSVQIGSRRCYGNFHGFLVTV